MKAVLVGLVAGALFALGLALGGMLDTTRVVAFLDVAGAWDPRLAFVMAGAILVYLPVHHWVAARRGAPTTHARIDRRIVLGSVLFGIGWALVGYCPGPAITSLGALATGRGSVETLVFFAAMVLGMALHRATARGAVPAVPRAADPEPILDVEAEEA